MDSRGRGAARSEPRSSWGAGAFPSVRISALRFVLHYDIVDRGNEIGYCKEVRIPGIRNATMEIVEMARMTSKGQVTVPAPIREILSLRKGSTVIFKVTEKGVLFLPCEVKERESYTREEWGKIERLVAEKGRIYKTSRGARKHLKSL